MKPDWSKLRPMKKIPVFELSARQREVGIYPEVLVGEGSIYVAVEGEFVVLSKEALSVHRRVEIDGMAPVLEWTEELLLVAGVDRVGMLDVRSQQLLWTAEDTLGAHRWREFLILGRENELSIIEPMTGQQKATIAAPGLTHGGFLPCGDSVLVKMTADGDSLRAVHLRDGITVWESSVLEELRAKYGIDDPKPALHLTPGSLGDRCIVARGARTFALSMSDGHVLWVADVRVPYYFPLVVKGKIPILALERFVVLDEATGRVLADSKHPQLRSMTFRGKGTPNGNTVAFVSESGHVALLDMNDGALLWSETYPVKFYDSAMAGDQLLATASDGQLWVFEDVT